MSSREDAYTPLEDEVDPAGHFGDALAGDPLASEEPRAGGDPGATEDLDTEEHDERSTGGEAKRSRVSASFNAWNSEVVTAETLIQYQISSAGGAAWTPRREMTRDDFEVVPADGLGRLRETLVVHEETLEPVLQCLESRRVALVVGERGVGKGAVCRMAAAAVVERDSEVQELLVAGRLERDVRWRPDRPFVESASHGHRILVLEDALEETNPDVTQFLGRLDEARLQGLQGALESSRSYLLLSIDGERLPARREQLARLGVLAAVEPPPETVLSQVLHRRLACRRIDLSREESELFDLAERILEERGAWLLPRLRTVPRAVRFCDELVLQVARGELTLETAVERLDDLEYWLLVELPADPPLWCFVLALVLASTDPRMRWVPWLSLHRLWRVVERAIAGEIEDGDTEKNPFRGLSRLVVDERFLARGRAEARTLPYPAGEAVRFVDPSTADRLWRILGGAGRAVLATLLPRLEALTRDEDPELRVLAARALGRAGRIEPRRLSSRLTDRWLTLEPDHAPALLGEMLTASLVAGDPEYAEGCFDDVKQAVAGGDEKKVFPAFLALAVAGPADPERVLKDLRGILTKQIGRRGDSAGRPATWIYSWVERRAKSHGGGGRGPGQPATADLEDGAYAFLGSRGAAVLRGCRYTLGGICFGGRCLEVVENLTHWMTDAEAPALAPWTSFLVLHDRGVLRLLERFPIRIGVGDATCSRILVAAEDEEAAADLAAFVEAAYAVCEPFPGSLRARLRENLLDALESWARSAGTVPELRPRGISLFSRLLESGDADLKKQVFDLLRNTGSSEAEDGAVATLGVEVLKRGLRATRGG